MTAARATGRIPDATLDAIRDRVDIVDVVGRHVVLSSKGDEYVGLCPFHAEKTPSFYVVPHKRIFHCFGCQKSGNVFQFLVEHTGRPFPDVVAELAASASVALDGSTPAPANVAPPRREDAEPPRRPPADEVASMWSAAGPVYDDETVAAWLTDVRAIPAERVSTESARALPRVFRAPLWADYWASMGYRCLFPVFDTNGVMVSLRARRVFRRGEQPQDDFPKSRAPGSKKHGLHFDHHSAVLANDIGRMLLAGTSLARGPSVPELVRKAGVWITEGETDFLAACVHLAQRADPPAVFGIVGANSWAQGIADKVPDGTTVCIATDDDKPQPGGKPGAGDLYAKRIADTFRKRHSERSIRLKRWRPAHG